MAARVAGAVGVALVVLAGGLALAFLRSDDHAAAPASGRTVIVAEGGKPLPETPFYALRDCLGHPETCVNGAEGIVLAYSVSGTVPTEPAAATVLTDDNCEPDRYGVSHCLNRLELADGAILTVRHDHKMGNDPCLAPGEGVVVQPT